VPKSCPKVEPNDDDDDMISNYYSLLLLLRTGNARSILPCNGKRV